MVTRNVSNQENFTTLTNDNITKVRDQPVGLIFLPPTWLLKYDLQMLKQNWTSLGNRPTTRQKAGYAPELKSGYGHCDHTRKKRKCTFKQPQNICCNTTDHLIAGQALHSNNFFSRENWTDYANMAATNSTIWIYRKAIQILKNRMEVTWNLHTSPLTMVCPKII